MMKADKKARIKDKTKELYDSLPQDKNERMKHIEVRDEVIRLNYTFFGYVAKTTYVNDPNATYEDKLQSCLLHFMETWWWYGWKEKYRTDLSFAVFFKPRLSEMIKRELNLVKYSVRRSLCMKVSNQLGKSWTEVTVEDLDKVKLNADDLSALKRILNATFSYDIDELDGVVSTKTTQMSDYMIDRLYFDEFDTIEELLMNQMLTDECKLPNSKLMEMSKIYSIDYSVLLQARPVAEQMLYDRLTHIRDTRE